MQAALAQLNTILEGSMTLSEISNCGQFHNVIRILFHERNKNYMVS